jgi:hypothetical protein
MRRLALGLLLLGCKGGTGSETAPVVISEIMYHPVLDDGPTEAHEFLEVENRTESPVDLGGWRLGGGVRFTFAAGTTLPAHGHLVVAKDRERLLADVPAYQLTAGGVVGNYDGELDNGGEKVTLSDGAGKLIDTAAYDDAFPWPVSADALGAGDEWLAPALLPLEQHRFMGRSLERTGTGPGTSAASWFPSPVDGATPGRANTQDR